MNWVESAKIFNNINGGLESDSFVGINDEHLEDKGSNERVFDLGPVCFFLFLQQL